MLIFGIIGAPTKEELHAMKRSKAAEEAKFLAGGRPPADWRQVCPGASSAALGLVAALLKFDPKVSCWAPLDPDAVRGAFCVHVHLTVLGGAQARATAAQGLRGDFLAGDRQEGQESPEEWENEAGSFIMIHPDPRPTSAPSVHRSLASCRRDVANSTTYGRRSGHRRPSQPPSQSSRTDQCCSHILVE